MTRIIMIRHGQSLANAQKRFAGHSDFDLTELGREQAECAAKYLIEIGEKPDVIYSSDLLRAHNTAAPIAREFGLPINDVEGLREIFAGSWEGMEVDEIYEKYTDDFTTWRLDIANARCTDGESVAELYARMVPFVISLAEQNDGKTILLATHATPVRAVDAFSKGFDAAHIGEVQFVRNSAMCIFEYENGSIKPIRTDIVDHLDPSLVTYVPKDLDGLKKNKDIPR